MGTRAQALKTPQSTTELWWMKGVRLWEESAQGIPRGVPE